MRDISRLLSAQSHLTFNRACIRVQFLAFSASGATTGRSDESLEVPFYFVRDKNGGLRGGVSGRYLWSDDEDTRGWSFSVVVAGAFKVGCGERNRRSHGSATSIGPVNLRSVTCDRRRAT